MADRGAPLAGTQASSAAFVAKQFRIWATQRLREYIIKGFTLDDERVKRGGAGNYFDELLARIRDIRSAEKVFWRKVLAGQGTAE